jgi:hypothetical protein
MKSKINERRFTKMKQKYFLGIFAIAIIAVLGISMVAARGFSGFGSAQNLTADEKAKLQEQHQAIQKAILEGDYTTWKSLMEERISKMQSQINEENFNALKEKHQKMSEFRTAMQEARESGNFSRVQELKEKYGFEGKRLGKEMKYGHIQMGNCPFAK